MINTLNKRSLTTRLVRGFCPCFLVKDTMPDGTLKYRLVIDARPVNIVTLGEAYITPTVEESISAMYDAKVFSSYDLKQAYHSIPLTEIAN